MSGLYSGPNLFIVVAPLPAPIRNTALWILTSQSSDVSHHLLLVWSVSGDPMVSLGPAVTTCWPVQVQTAGQLPECNLQHGGGKGLPPATPPLPITGAGQGSLLPWTQPPPQPSTFPKFHGLLISPSASLGIWVNQPTVHMCTVQS